MKTRPFVLCSLVLAGVAHAEERERPRPGKPPVGGAGQFILHADKDGDGAVSLDEFSALERVAGLPEEKRTRLFEHLDKNGDGFIRRDEMPQGPKGPPDREGKPPFGLRQLDANKDGAVDFDEFSASPFAERMPEDRRRAFFDRLDRNGDGRVSPEDRPEGRPPEWRDRPDRPEGKDRPEAFDPAVMFKRFDANGDGGLDFGEFRKLPWVQPLGEDAQEDRFEKLDANGDMKIQPSEMEPPRDGPRPDRRKGPQDGRPNRPGPPDRDRQGPPPVDDAPMMEDGA